MFINPDPDDAAAVQIEIKSDGEWIDAAFPMMVGPGEAVAYEYNNTNITSSTGIRVGGALRATSDRPVEIVQFSPSLEVFSHGGWSSTHLLPISAWGDQYRVLGWAAGAPASQSAGGFQVVVIAAVDGTVIDVFPPAALLSGLGFNGAAAGAAFQVELDAGDNFGAVVTTDDASLAGMLIQSDPDHPIAVLSANINAQVGGEQNFERTFEQNLPIDLWGTQYVGLRPPPNIGDPPAAAHWQIVAHFPNTVVDIDYSGSITGVPAVPAMMQPGQVLEFAISGTDNHGDFTITATQPVGVMAFMPGKNFESGTAAIAIPPVDRLRESYTVYRPELLPGLNWVLSAGADPGASVYFDELLAVPLSETLLDVGWQAYRFELPEGVTVVSTDEPFVGTIGGWGYLGNYDRGHGYLAGMTTE